MQIPPRARPSPNIWRYPQTYELENRWMDPAGALSAAIRRVHDWSGQTVLDVGCGTGFHLPEWAASARFTIGLEPHLPLAHAARERSSGLGLAPHPAVGPEPGTSRGGVAVICGLAEQLPLPDRSVDLAHARWAYFFGPGSEPGLAELSRVIRPGGTAVVIDHDATRSTFGSWFRRERPAYDPLAVERFWRRHGWTPLRLLLNWQMPTRAAFESVIRIEFTPATAEAALVECAGAGVDHAVNLWWRRF